MRDHSPAERHRIGAGGRAGIERCARIALRRQTRGPRRELRRDPRPRRPERRLRAGRHLRRGTPRTRRGTDAGRTGAPEAPAAARGRHARHRALCRPSHGRLPGVGPCCARAAVEVPVVGLSRQRHRQQHLGDRWLPVHPAGQPRRRRARPHRHRDQRRDPDPHQGRNASAGLQPVAADLLRGPFGPGRQLHLRPEGALRQRQRPLGRDDHGSHRQRHQRGHLTAPDRGFRGLGSDHRHLAIHGLQQQRVVGRLQPLGRLPGLRRRRGSDLHFGQPVPLPVPGLPARRRAAVDHSQDPLLQRRRTHQRFADRSLRGLDPRGDDHARGATRRKSARHDRDLVHIGRLGGWWRERLRARAADRQPAGQPDDRLAVPQPWQHRCQRCTAAGPAAGRPGGPDAGPGRPALPRRAVARRSAVDELHDQPALRPGRRTVDRALGAHWHDQPRHVDPARPGCDRRREHRRRHAHLLRQHRGQRPRAHGDRLRGFGGDHAAKRVVLGPPARRRGRHHADARTAARR